MNRIGTALSSKCALQKWEWQMQMQGKVKCVVLCWWRPAQALLGSHVQLLCLPCKLQGAFGIGEA